MTNSKDHPINLDESRYDQSTFMGRLKHFFTVTDPRNVLVSDFELDLAKRMCDDYKSGVLKIGDNNLTEEDLWKAKKIRDSAFHPDTGEKQLFIGRMSFQVPGNMFISGCMMTFYSSTPAVIFWQWVNQSFNCIVNYTNRNASATISNTQLGAAYVGACTASMGVAVGLNKIVALRPAWSGGLVGRLVPFAAVAAANCVNIPLMRQVELKDGIDVSTADGLVLGQSPAAAKGAVAQVVPSRICMAIPGMTIPPIVMNHLSKKPFMKRMPFLAMPMTIGMAGLSIFFATPICCALFPQRSEIPISQLEPELAAKAKALGVEHLYYNKGL